MIKNNYELTAFPHFHFPNIFGKYLIETNGIQTKQLILMELGCLEKMLSFDVPLLTRSLSKTD